jgi:hypothetical protein
MFDDLRLRGFLGENPSDNERSMLLFEEFNSSCNKVIQFESYLSQIGRSLDDNSGMYKKLSSITIGVNTSNKPLVERKIIDFQKELIAILGPER